LKSNIKFYVICVVLLALPGLALAQKDEDEKQSRNSKNNEPVNLPRGMSLVADIGLLNYDSNVYRTNDAAYVDLFQDPAGTITVTPVVQSGFYFPLEAMVNYRHMLKKGVFATTGLNMDGSLYTGPKLKDATEYTLDYHLGLMYKTNRRAAIAELFFVNDKNIYYDRDSGDVKQSSGGADISEKYVYSAYGVDMSYDYKRRKYDYFTSLLYENRDYKDTTFVSQMDHNILEMAVGGGYKLAKPLKVSVGYEYAANKYSDRHARQLNGKLFTSQPLLVYLYHTIDSRIRYRAGDNWIFSVKHKYQQRNDAGYQDYNDYVANEVSGNIVYRINKFRVKTSAGFHSRDYANALAFDKPEGGAKTYSYYKAAFKTSYKLKKWLSISGQLKYKDVVTNDLRYDYERYQISTGLKIKL